MWVVRLLMLAVLTVCSGATHIWTPALRATAPSLVPLPLSLPGLEPASEATHIHAPPSGSVLAAVVAAAGAAGSVALNAFVAQQVHADISNTASYNHFVASEPLPLVHHTPAGFHAADYGGHGECLYTALSGVLPSQPPPQDVAATAIIYIYYHWDELLESGQTWGEYVSAQHDIEYATPAEYVQHAMQPVSNGNSAWGTNAEAHAVAHAYNITVAVHSNNGYTQPFNPGAEEVHVLFEALSGHWTSGHFMALLVRVVEALDEVERLQSWTY